MDDILFKIITLGIALWLFSIFLKDCRGNSGAHQPLEGASKAPLNFCMIGAFLALVMVAASTAAECWAGVSQEQSDVPFYELVFWMAAAFVEELIFRGYLVVKNRGAAALVGSVIFFSAVFTLAHPFFWDYTPAEGSEESVLTFSFGAFAWISSATIFANSLIFYWLRFSKFNPKRSLIPSICAHLSYNVGVYAVKLAQGHVVF